MPQPAHDTPAAVATANCVDFVSRRACFHPPGPRSKFPRAYGEKARVRGRPGPREEGEALRFGRFNNEGVGRCQALGEAFQPRRN